nr:MAG: ORF1 [Torque teno midi virus]UHK06761.1 MAG: ORF1 [Torque teno midi virus]
MAFWWRRRRRWWRGNRRPFYKRRKRRQYRRKRWIRRYKYRRPARRRKRRRQKVRRKRKKIKIEQWQPEKIVKCRIKGLTLLLLGAQGKQFACYTNEEFNWTPSRTPGGGGFAVERFTLQSLYNDFKLGRNYWSKSNLNLDLCRYTGCKIKLFRHRHTDFIVSYKLQPPFNLDKDTYMNSNPYDLMLRTKHKIVPSHKTKPNGRQTVTLRIKPPKQMNTHWYFQETFRESTLVQLTATAINLNYSYLAPTGQNQLLSLLGINQQFYYNASWGNTNQGTKNHYNPLTGNKDLSPNLKVKYRETDTAFKDVTVTQENYSTSISYEKGWFQSALLKAVQIQSQEVLPITAFRYNPTIDNGSGNAVWLSSVLNSTYNKPTSDKTLIIENQPLWKALFGFFNFVQAVKGDKQFLRSYIVILQSPAIFPYKDIGTKNYHIPIDRSFIDGQGPYKQPPTQQQKKLWFPTLENQLESINYIVQCGPYVPKYQEERESNWQLPMFYYFYFKWGGSFNPDEPVADPSGQRTYPVPNQNTAAVQVINPKKQAAESILHAWDYRRGYITKTAIKRIQEYQETDTDFQTDADSQAPPKKKICSRALQYIPEEEEEIQSCLQELFKENTSQETQETQDLRHLIKQQQEQQQSIKLHLLQLISNLKKKQRILQLQTGLLE